MVVQVCSVNLCTFHSRPLQNNRDFKIRRRQRQRRYAERFNEDNNGCARALSWYMSLPSSAKQQRKMIKFYVVWRT